MILYKKIILFLLFVSFALYAGKDCGHDHNSNCNHSQSANTTCRDFANILNFAKYSACENVINKFEYLDKGFGKFIIKKLESNTKDLFPWRFEVTNGYQEGFFYHALMGIALENKDDIISAYNEFCSSLSYIDEEKSFNHPKLRHEIELAIARIYLEVGRLNDAQEWFESVRIESSDNNILVAADSGLIARAVAFGDYKEACEMCEDLGTLTTLTREQFNAYAKVLFSLGKDREAFSQLLTGIAKYGFDEKFGLKEPMVNLFLNALPRATNNEIEWYYDLVGYGIMEARAQKGDEKHLTILLKTRMLFSAVFPFLDPEDDMKKLVKRIEYLKTNVVYQLANRYINKKSDLIFNALYQNRKLALKTNFFNNITTEFQLELLLMKAESMLLKSDSIDKTIKLYEKVYFSLTNDYLKQKPYDDSTFYKIAEMGIVLSEAFKCFATDLPVPEKIIYKSNNIIFDNSQKMAGMQILLSYINKSPQPCVDDCLAMFPKSNPQYLQWINFKILNAINNNKLKDAKKFSEQYYDIAGQLTPDIYHKMIFVYIALGDTKKAFNVAMDGLLYFYPFRLTDEFHYHGSYWYRQLCRNLYSWASDKDIHKFNRIQLISELPEFLMEFNPQISTRQLRSALHWQSKFGKNELSYRDAYNNEHYELALDILTNKFGNSKQSGHQYKKAICLDKIGKSENAFYEMLKSINTRKRFVNQFIKNINYTAIERNLLEKCAIDDKTKKMYSDFLNDNFQ